ncbi:MAG: MMPL family transporter [Candidatus Dormibacteria bacterium]
MLQRLARPLSRRPLMVLLAALVVVASAAAGLVRFNVDAGQGLLVGSSSDAGRANTEFTAAFGTDPIVVVLSTPVAASPYIEKNLQRLVALEDDLSHDPSVATVLGPGTVALSALSATTSEVSKTLTEYPYFVAETHLLLARQQGVTDQATLQKQLRTDITDAGTLLQLYVSRAARDAHDARVAYQQAKPPPTDRILDSQERAADAAAHKDPLPPLFANYLAGPGVAANEAAAHEFFDRLTAAYGDCSQQIATLLGITPTCQTYLARFLLDLPNCPTYGQVQAAVSARKTTPFCPPKPQWAGVLPPPATNADGSTTSNEIITVRLTPEAAANRSAVLAVQQKIEAGLRYGIGTPHGINDAYTASSYYTANRLASVKALGGLAPTTCGDVGAASDSACYTRFNDRAFTWTIAGAPLLTYGVVDAMTQNLLVLLPLALVLMAILLVVTLRLRGRLWPLLAAVAATAATVGGSLWIGLSITPAVLAGIPVLVGLGVDYAVQMVARYDEARRGGGEVEAAAATALGRSGPATLTAALATFAGLAALMVVSGVDLGPLVAVPLVAEFALVLCAGVALAWLGAVFVALPAAVLFDRRGATGEAAAAPSWRAPQRTLGIASAWRGAVVPAVIASLVGWVLLPGIPVQTDVEELLAPSLPQVQAINQVREQTGYSNEVDLYVRGQVAGPYNQAGIPDNVTWECLITEQIRSQNSRDVAMATSIADYFIASTASSSQSAGAPCAAIGSSTGASTSPSPGASPSPAASGTPAGASSSPSSPPAPTASTSPSAVRPARAVLLASGPASPVPSTSAAPSGPAAASPSGSASPPASPAPSGTTSQPPVTQTGFVCDLRLLPGLARNLVAPIPLSTQPCPAVDKYFNTWLSADPDPIDPNAARIVIGVQGTSVASQAHLIDSIRNGLRSAPPPNGMSAAPVGIAALAAQAYDNLLSRGLLLNLAPLLVVFGALLLIERDLRRASLPVLPTALAAGWAPLLIRLLGLLPGSLGRALGSFNPLTVVLGALVIALATEFGVVLLRRFDEEMARGWSPDDAAAVTLASTGRAIRVSALTLGAGFAVLALSALLPNGLPLLGAFGFTVLVDLALAVTAVFGIMLPVAVAIERQRWVPGAVAPVPVRGEAEASPAPLPEAPGRDAGPRRRRPQRPRLVDEPLAAATAGAAPAADPAPAPAPPRRRPSVSGRRRAATGSAPGGDPEASAPPPARRPGVSGRRRRGPVVPGEGDAEDPAPS